MPAALPPTPAPAPAPAPALPPNPRPRPRPPPAPRPRRQRMLDMGLDVLGDTNSPVMPVMMYSPIMIAAFSHACLARHVATVVVAFPATPLALARTRICISAAHSREDIEYALEVRRGARSSRRPGCGCCSGPAAWRSATAAAAAADAGAPPPTPRPAAAAPAQVLADVTAGLKLQFKGPSTLRRLRNLLTISSK
jgi:hypothetical protein